MAVTDPGITPDVVGGDGVHISTIEAGHNRREELKRRMDALTAEAESIANELQAEGIDPSKLTIDREVAQHFTQSGDVYIDNKQPGYRYCLTYRDPYGKFAGQFVWRNMAEGWEIVRGNMPEGREFPGMSVTGERWVADCLLMRIPESRIKAIEAERTERRLAMQQLASEPSDELNDAARRFNTKITTTDQLPQAAQRAMRGSRRGPVRRSASY